MPQIRMSPDVLFEHAGLLAAYATFFAHIFPPATAANVSVVLVGFESAFKDLDSFRWLGLARVSQGFRDVIWAIIIVVIFIRVVGLKEKYGFK